MKNARLFIIIGIALLICLQYNLWFSQNGLLSSHHINHGMAHLSKKNKKLMAKNNSLKEDIHALKHDPSAIAKKARENFGMIKKGETYYNIVGDHQDSVPGAQTDDGDI
jgi:cell division protein FtsB